MKNGAQTKPGVTLTDMFRGFPLAYAVFILAAIVFGVFDFGSYIASATLQRPYERWLEISEPTTNGVARFVPAVDSATGYLQMYRGSYLIPAVRNVLSINFLLLLFFPLCFALALCIDVFRGTERALNNIIAVSEKLKISIGEAVLRCIFFLLLLLFPIYFGYGVSPYIIGFGATIIYYVIVFGGNGLALFIAFYFLTCFIVVRLMRRSEYLTTAVVKEQDDLNGGGEYD